MSLLHKRFLDTHCRMCAKRLGKSKYSVQKYKEIIKVYGIDPFQDSIDIHPQFFCNSCYLTAKHLKSTEEKGGFTTTNRVIFNWVPHTDSDCIVCTVKIQGGRPKKISSSGRPTDLEQHIKATAGIIPNAKVLVNSVIGLSQPSILDITCGRCNMIVSHPLEILPCKKLVCRDCCLCLVKQKPCFKCPGCSEFHETVYESFSKVSPVVDNILMEVVMRCQKCGRQVKLGKYTDEDCNSHVTQVTAEEMINQPLEAEPTKLEKQAAVNVVSRLLHHSKDQVVRLQISK